MDVSFGAGDPVGMVEVCRNVARWVTGTPLGAGTAQGGNVQGEGAGSELGGSIVGIGDDLLAFYGLNMDMSDTGRRRMLLDYAQGVRGGIGGSIDNVGVASTNGGGSGGKGAAGGRIGGGYEGGGGEGGGVVARMGGRGGGGGGEGEKNGLPWRRADAATNTHAMPGAQRDVGVWDGGGRGSSGGSSGKPSAEDVVETPSRRRFQGSRG